MAVNLEVELVEATKLPSGRTIDPYAKLQFGKKIHMSEGKTGPNPRWNQKFEFKIDDFSEKLSIEIYDRKLIGADPLVAKAKLPINRYRRLGVIDKRYPLVDENDKDIESEIYLKIYVNEDAQKRSINLLREMRENQGSLRNLSLKVQKDGEEREVLENELNTMKKTQTNMENRFAELKNANEELENSNSEFKEENGKLKSEIEDLLSAQSTLVSRSEYAKLRREYDQLAEVGQLDDSVNIEGQTISEHRQETIRFALVELRTARAEKPVNWDKIVKISDTIKSIRNW